MRILTVSDKVEPVLYGPYIRERVGQVDLILACGDLPYYYLEYIVGLLDVPLYYVHGNHDKVVAPNRHDVPSTDATVSWATNLNGRTVEHRGLLLAGLEGCRRYSPERPFQYTEREMRFHTSRLGLKLLPNKLRHGRYLDILITHAPPRGIHDDEDIPHQGFESYLNFMRTYRPMLLIHGHQHVYNRNLTMETVYLGTRVLNTYGYRVIELVQNEGRWQLVSSSC
ncbi:MAG: metallophosphoesterase [Nitrososphaerales archaeon]